MEALHGLSTINIELTSRCNKSCWMCGRRKIEKEYPEIAKNWGDMDFALVEKIAKQLPPGIVVQFHNNGEPLLYPRFGEAVELFKKQIRCVDTNAKLIVEKADEIIGNLDTITISVVEDDPDAEEQHRLVKEFLDIKKDDRPAMVYRLLGKVRDYRWKRLPGIVAYRTIHNPMGSFGYTTPRIVSEIGICLDALHHPAIDRWGNVSMCVRFDRYRELFIGNIQQQSLREIWNGDTRAELVALHKEGYRNDIPFCAKCDYWGVPG